jgi:predicted transcriptional regulator
VVNDKQTKMIRVRLTPDLKAWLEARASKRELSESAIVRLALLDAREAEQLAAIRMPLPPAKSA